MCWGLFMTCLVLFSGQVLANVRLLKCHSVNVIPRNTPIEYVFISTKKEDCTFVFEGPQYSKLDMEVRSVSFPKRFADNENCRKSKLTIYNYIDSKIILGKLVCNENEKASLLTKSNMGIVTSSLTDGSFSINIRPQTPNSTSHQDVAGMQPPLQDAEDYFLERDNAVSEGFKPIAGGFRPSPLLQQYTEAKPFLSSAYHPHRPGFYLGKPTEIVDITYNSTGHNFTIITHKPVPPAGVEEYTTVQQPANSIPNTTEPLANETFPTSGTQAKPTTVNTTTVIAQASAATPVEPFENE